jgi:DNA repair protein Crb2 Tudor domain
MGLFDWFSRKTNPAPGSAWKVGDRVMAQWRDAFFYPGRVRAVSNDSCEVQFDDGDGDWVASAQIQRADIRVGSRVFARVHGGPMFAPATVNQQRGEKLQVSYDHGEEEWTSLSLIRLQQPGADVPSPTARPTPQGQAIDLGEPLSEGAWRVGDRVLARWLDFFWYPGTILALGTKGFHILYDDGDQRVAPEQALMPLALEEGEHIQIRPKNQPQRIYSPAVVTRVDGETLDVEYQDGERETNTKASRARLWRCPVAVRELPFEEGERVLAYDVDGFVYPAEILSIEEDRVVVQFLDGPERMLTPELIRPFKLGVGSRVECRWKGGPAYFPGVLAKVEDERVFVRYDDGDEEWTSVRLVRLKPAS